MNDVAEQTYDDTGQERCAYCHGLLPFQRYRLPQTRTLFCLESCAMMHDMRKQMWKSEVAHAAWHLA